MPLRVWCVALGIGLVWLGMGESAAGQQGSRGERESAGTLFRWTTDAAVSGGPDLGAPLVTDRPDFTEAASTVGRGVRQFELGYTFASDREGGLRTASHSYPEVLMRAGIVADWLELRLGQSFSDVAEGSSRQRGAEDLYVGLKLGLTPQAGRLPELALIPQATIPTGSGSFSRRRMLAGVNLIYAWEVGDRVSTAGSTQFNSQIDEVTGSLFVLGAQSWTVGYELTERLGAYAEWFALFPHGADSASPEHYFNGGLTVQLSDNLQWDVRVGAGLNRASDDFFVGTGLSWRLVR